MKICFFAGANSLHSHRWIRYFINIGHEVHWVSLTPLTVGDSISNLNFYEIKQSPIKIFSILESVFRVRELIKKIKPEILHAHYAGTYGLLGALSSFHPFVVTAWGSDVLISGQHWLKGHLVRFVLKKADLITCDADHMIEAMSGLGIDKEKMKLVYFGVEPEKFKPGEKNRELLNKWNVNGSPVIISLRNLEPIYYIETLLKSVPLVLKDVPNAKFVIAGAGSQEKYLKNLAQTIKISDSVRFIGSYIHAELPCYLNSADICVSTSLSDAGIASSTAEAMACGLPVIITDSGENRKWIQDGENGLVVPIKNSNILAKKIIYLLKHAEVRKKIGMEGRKTIENKNNYYKEMEKMGKLYKEIIEEKRQKKCHLFLH